jgi:hypothetical protein
MIVRCANGYHHQHHSWRWALLEKLPIVQPLKNSPAFYGTRRFITVFTRALHWFISWAWSIQSVPSHPISLRSILILSTHLHLALPSGLFPLVFPQISYMQFVLYVLPISTWLHHCNYTWRRVQVMKLLIMQFSPICCHFICLRAKYSQISSVYVPSFMSETKPHAKL